MVDGRSDNEDLERSAGEVSRGESPSIKIEFQRLKASSAPAKRGTHPPVHTESTFSGTSSRGVD
jgi:hypothetical protein